MIKKIFIILTILLFTFSFSYANKLNLNLNHKPFIDTYNRCGITDLIEIKPITLTQLQIFEIDSNCYNKNATLYLTDNNNTFEYSLDTLTKASPVIYLGEDTNTINTNIITDAYLYIDGWPYKTALGELWDDEQELPFVSCVNLDNPTEECKVTYIKGGWGSGENRTYELNVKVDGGNYFNWKLTFNFDAQGSFILDNDHINVNQVANTSIDFNCQNRHFSFTPVFPQSNHLYIQVKTFYDGSTFYCPARP